MMFLKFQTKFVHVHRCTIFVWESRGQQELFNRASYLLPNKNYARKSTWHIYFKKTRRDLVDSEPTDPAPITSPPHTSQSLWIKVDINRENAL